MSVHTRRTQFREGPHSVSMHVHAYRTPTPNHPPLHGTLLPTEMETCSVITSQFLHKNSRSSVTAFPLSVTYLTSHAIFQFYRLECCTWRFKDESTLSNAAYLKASRISARGAGVFRWEALWGHFWSLRSAYPLCSICEQLCMWDALSGGLSCCLPMCCMNVVCGGGREQIRQAFAKWIPPSIHITADCARSICIRACVFIRALCSKRVFLKCAYCVEYHCDGIAIWHGQRNIGQNCAMHHSAEFFTAQLPVFASQPHTFTIECVGIRTHSHARMRWIMLMLSTFYWCSRGTYLRWGSADGPTYLSVQRSVQTLG